MSETLKIRLAARCAAAGRPENEDNFQVAEDLSISNVGFDTDKIFPLGSKGTLLLVCDGMGGMNAGEVASAIGVETIKNLFAPQMLTNEVTANDESICAYMKRAIVKADSRIKEEAQKDSAKQGMGSTAVMAWLLGQKVYVAWCGDSRCYRYNPATGLEILSHDHSYVQDLVDTGQLSPELAFDHPNKNIITRSLGDPRGAARPDVKVYNLHIGDVILLCSDGLNDSLRDSQIEQAISRSLTSMGSCLATLWSDSNMAGWHDNVTIVLAQVVDENALSSSRQPIPPSSKPQGISETQIVKSSSFKTFLKRNWRIIIVAVIVILLLVACVWLGTRYRKCNDCFTIGNSSIVINGDTIKFTDSSNENKSIDVQNSDTTTIKNLKAQYDRCLNFRCGQKRTKMKQRWDSLMSNTGASDTDNLTFYNNLKYQQ